MDWKGPKISQGREHAPEVTPFGIKISLEDWELYKVIIDKNRVVLNAMKALAGKEKMAEDNDEQ